MPPPTNEAVGSDDKMYYKSDTFDMNEYVKYRPPYSDHFYNHIYKNHKGGWDSALDIATGPGMAARELATKFEHVVGVDFNPNFVKVAGSLSQNYNNVEFKEAVAEDLSQFADNSFDMVFIAEAAHWFENEAFEEVGRVLKPNGTLAMWFYGTPFVKGNHVASKLLRDCVYRFGRAIPYSELIDASYQRITSGLDCCKLPENYFAPGSKRLRVNYKECNLVPHGAFPCRVALPPYQIPIEDEFIYLDDPDFLTTTRPWYWIKEFMKVLIPMEDIDFDKLMEEEFTQLEKELGDQTDGVKFSWAVSMVIAHKRGAEN